MSINDIKTEIRSLSPAEREVISAFIKSIKDDSVEAVRYVPRDEAIDAAKRIIAANPVLLEKLSQ